MTRFLLRRVALSLVVLALVTTATFVATLKLGDPTVTLLGEHATPEDREHARHFYGLNLPVTTQLAMYVGHLVRGDLGTSYRHHRPVAALIAERLPRTLLLGGMALALQTVLGVGLGSLAAARHGRTSDSVIMGATFVATSTPENLTGTLLLLFVAYGLGWFPIGGYGVGTLEHLHAAILPALTLAVTGMAYYARLTRGEMIDALRADYLRTARAKGSSPARAIVVHALRNSVTPVLADLGTSVGALLGGAVLTESVFAWPGLGKLAVDSITGLDVPVIVGCVMVGTVGIVLGNALGDVVCAMADPRVRAGVDSTHSS